MRSKYFFSNLSKRYIHGARLAGEGRSKVKFGAKIRKEWDLKTSQEGVVKIPPIPKGNIQIQVRADNFQTFGQTFEIREDERLVEIKLKPPQPQYSAHDKDKDK